MMRRSLAWLALLGAGLLAVVPTPGQAQTSPSLPIWFPGPGATGDATYTGTLDQPASATSTQVSGWVVDTTAQGWSGIDDVQIWNGFMDLGGQLVAHPTLQVDRPDVASSLNNPYWASSGYSGTLSTGAYSLGSVLYIYAHTPSKGWWYQEVVPNFAAPPTSFVLPPRLDIETPTVLATVHSQRPYTMRGTAYDPAASPSQGTGVDRVQVYLNGDRKSGIYIGDATLGVYDQFSAAAGPQFANAGWQLTFQTGSWLNTVIDNTIVQMTVYAHSSVTGQETFQQVSIEISIP